MLFLISSPKIISFLKDEKKTFKCNRFHHQYFYNRQTIGNDPKIFLSFCFFFYITSLVCNKDYVDMVNVPDSVQMAEGQCSLNWLSKTNDETNLC